MAHSEAPIETQRFYLPASVKLWQGCTFLTLFSVWWALACLAVLVHEPATFLWAFSTAVCVPGVAIALTLILRRNSPTGVELDAEAVTIVWVVGRTRIPLSEIAGVDLQQGEIVLARKRSLFSCLIPANQFGSLADLEACRTAIAAAVEART